MAREQSVVGIAVPLVKHLCKNEPVPWGSEAFGAAGSCVLPALHRVFAMAAEAAHHEAGGSPHLICW